MANLITAAVVIEGYRPLLWNAFTLDAIPLSKKEKTGVAGNDPEEWKRTVLVTAERQLYLPSTYIFGCLRDGARYTRQGRSTIQSRVAATLQVVETPYVLTNCYLPADPLALTVDPTQAVYMDIRSVRNPVTKGRNIRYRIAAAPGWRVTFHLAWDVTIVSREQMEAAAIDAGHLCGLGDGRQIGFGRFETMQFSVAG